MDVFASARANMVELQLRRRGITDARVLAAMAKVPRERFVPAEVGEMAYADRPLVLAHGQTISQPYIVAYMTEALALRPTDRVLDVGTGSGYQAAILAEIVREVYTVEIVRELAERARRTLEALGYRGVRARVGDGFHGFADAAPFDAIVAAAAPQRIPAALVHQLAEGGRLVLPLGGESQRLVRVVRRGDRLDEEELLPVRFVPMTGLAEDSLPS
jgi:protein-L-isoaspartate(D-aspartate) O-methyltransferase